MTQAVQQPVAFAGQSSHIKTVGVIGAGQMGHGIAQVMACKSLSPKR